MVRADGFCAFTDSTAGQWAPPSSPCPGLPHKGVIYHLMFIQRKIPDVDGLNLDEPFLDGSGQNAFPQREETYWERG